MLINVDAKGLEWVAALGLAKDKVGIDEYNQGFDIHSDNQRRLELPTRVVAKGFLFRVIYADEVSGGAFAFSHDPDFTHVSRSTRRWQERIDSFFTKYEGLKIWHADLLRKVGSTGTWTSPTGRTYVFNKKRLGNGDLVWPKTQIYNYPVQGLGHEIMAIVRVAIHQKIRSLPFVLPVVTVHDSVLLDSPEEFVYPVCRMIDDSFRSTRRNIERLFGWDLGLEVKGEISIGPNWGDMRDITKEEYTQ